jgi:NitT/TauT family transport system substrate-binding protein
VHENSAAQSLSDLRGMTLQAGSGRPYLKFMEAQGFLEGVQIVPYSGVPNLVANPDSAMQAYSFSEPMLAQQEGVNVRLLMLSEIGFNPYASCLLATEDYIAGQSDIVGRMVQACREGWQKYFESPQETNAAILAANEHGMTMEALKFGVDELRPLCITSEVSAEDMGEMTSARWETLVEQFVKIDLIDAGKVTANQVFTLDFLQKPAAQASTP